MTSPGQEGLSQECVDRALALEQLLLGQGLITDQPILAAQMQDELEGHLNKQIVELLGRPPIRRTLYATLGDLVILGKAQDTSDGMVFQISYVSEGITEA